MKRDEGFSRWTSPGGAALLLAGALLLGGCSTFFPKNELKRPSGDQEYSEEVPVDDSNSAVKIAIEPPGTPGTTNREVDITDPKDVIEHARNLAAEARHGESAQIYLDAAKRFQSVGKKFENHCLKEAVIQLYFDGNYSKAKELLAKLDGDQDIYGQTSENIAFRNVRKIVYSTKSPDTKAAK